jgi:IclR family transcriptional regulator, acetate operon repressor
VTTPPVRTLDKALDIMERLRLDQASSFRELVDELDLPPATAHRIMATLRRRGFLLRTARDRYFAGTRLARSGGRALPPALLADVAKPHLASLARRLALTAQIGVLEDGMVTYLAKAEHRNQTLFTREGMQLEAYCSAIGKVLLAALPGEEREAYLGDGPFVAITPNTITEPDDLRRELRLVSEQSYAEDREEIQAELRCLAVPVNGPDGIIAAISVSGSGSSVPSGDMREHLATVRGTTRALEDQLFPGCPATLAGTT